MIDRSNRQSPKSLFSVLDRQRLRELVLDVDLVVCCEKRDLRPDSSAKLAQGGVEAERIMSVVEADALFSVLLHSIKELSASGSHNAKRPEEITCILQACDLIRQESTNLENGMNTMARFLPCVIVVKNTAVFEGPKHTTGDFSIQWLRRPLRSKRPNRESVQGDWRFLSTSFPKCTPYPHHEGDITARNRRPPGHTTSMPSP